MDSQSAGRGHISFTGPFTVTSSLNKYHKGRCLAQQVNPHVTDCPYDADDGGCYVDELRGASGRHVANRPMGAGAFTPGAQR